jgi:hypothetical protein
MPWNCRRRQAAAARLCDATVARRPKALDFKAIFCCCAIAIHGGTPIASFCAMHVANGHSLVSYPKFAPERAAKYSELRIRDTKTTEPFAGMD